MECVPKGSEKKEGEAIKRFAELMEKNIEVIEIKGQLSGGIFFRQGFPPNQRTFLAQSHYSAIKA